MPPTTNPERSPGTLSAVLIASLGLAVGALVFFSWLAEEVFEGNARNFDTQVRFFVHQHSSPALTKIMLAFSFLGSVQFVTVVMAVSILLFLRMRWKRAAAWMLLSGLGAAALDVTLKSMFERARPLPFFVPEPHSYSFPSGHALGSFCIYGVLAGLLTARIRNRRIRVLIWVAAGLLVGMIGYSRIYLGVHWPTDVIAGYAAAAVWVGGLVSLDRWRRHFRARAGSSLASEGK